MLVSKIYSTMSHACLLAMLLFLAGASSQVHAASSHDRWAYPIPVPASAASSPQLRRALQHWNQQQLREARECGRGLQELRPDLKFHKTSDLPYSNLYREIFDSPMLYSVAVTTDFFCGGPYPVTDYQAVSWEVGSGRAFDPLTLYQIGERTEERIIRVRPEVRRMIRKQLIRKTAGSGCRKFLREDSLEYLEPDSLGLAKSGLYVAVNGVYAIAMCYGPIVLDHRYIRKYLQREVAARIGWPLR